MRHKEISRAVHICGSQRALAYWCNDKKTTSHGHVSHWLKNGVKPEWAATIEHAVDQAIAASNISAERAAESGGRVTCERLCPDVQWQRDEARRVTGYLTPVLYRGRRCTPVRPRPNIRRQPGAGSRQRK